MYKGLNCDRKSQLSEILTEPLNPRGSLSLSCNSILTARNIFGLLLQGDYKYKTFKS